MRFASVEDESKHARDRNFPRLAVGNRSDEFNDFNAPAQCTIKPTSHENKISALAGPVGLAAHEM